MSDKRTHVGPLRRGAILAIVLACLLVVMLLGGQLVQATLTGQRQMRQLEHRQQALWLAESAVQRALQALAESSDYPGETWQWSDDGPGLSQTGRAVIAVEPVADSDTRRVIRVAAYWPDDPVHRVLYEREYVVD
jgi:Tfp pilus assembly protein PilX